MTTQPDQNTSAEGTVTVVESDAGTYTQEIIAGGHRLVADEPRPFGDDAGPSPYDLLLSALGACTSMTVRMYANKNGWPLEQVRVSLRHTKIHAKDCADCETSATGMIDHMDREIELIGDLDDDQREKLLSIAERCPVHRTLTSTVHVSTTLRPPNSPPA